MGALGRHVGITPRVLGDVVVQAVEHEEAERVPENFECQENDDDSGQQAQALQRTRPAFSEVMFVPFPERVVEQAEQAVSSKYLATGDGAEDTSHSAAASRAPSG